MNHTFSTKILMGVIASGLIFLPQQSSAEEPNQSEMIEQYIARLEALLSAASANADPADHGEKAAPDQKRYGGLRTGSLQGSTRLDGKGSGLTTEGDWRRQF